MKRMVIVTVFLAFVSCLICMNAKEHSFHEKAQVKLPIEVKTEYLKRSLLNQFSKNLKNKTISSPKDVKIEDKDLKQSENNTAATTESSYLKKEKISELRSQITHKAELKDGRGLIDAKNPKEIEPGVWEVEVPKRDFYPSNNSYEFMKIKSDKIINR